MSFEENNFDDNAPDDGQLPEESSNNRTFLIAAGILGGIILISIACLVGVYLFTQTTTAQVDTQATALAQTAEASSNFINESLTATANAAILPTATLPPTATLVVNVATVTSTVDPNATVGADPLAAGTPAAATATVGAALTQAAIAQLTIVPTTTALPNTGFADDFGIPGLVVMSLAFIIVILMARRLRFTPSR
jgi:hypothetical protein